MKKENIEFEKKQLFGYPVFQFFGFCF